MLRSRRAASARSPRTRALLESLESRTLLSGVTLITHGLGADASAWVTGMGNAIAARADLANDYVVYKLTVTDPNHAGGALSASISKKFGGNPKTVTKSPEIVLLLDWGDVAGSIFGGYSRSSTDVGIAVANALTSATFLPELGAPLASLPIHLLGHSRGASVAAQIAAQLARRNVWVDQLTTFDPVPISLYGDPVAFAGQNVVYYDNYYQTQDSIANGTAISGAHNVGSLSLPGAYVNFLGNGYHDNVHLYYHGTIDPSSGAKDGSRSVPANWYTSTTQRQTTGFYWSRMAGGARPSGGVGPIGGGNATRKSVTEDLTRWSNIGQIALTNAQAQYVTGAAITASFRYQDKDSSATVTWYLDPDRNPFNGNEVTVTSQTVGSSAGPSTGTLTGAIPANVSGNVYLLARISDGQSARYDYARNAINVVQQTIQSSVDQFTGGWVAGWTYDPKAPNTPASIRVDINGVTVATFASDGNRPDLAPAFGSSNHGFYYVLPRLQTGSHTVSVFATASGVTTQLASRVISSVSPFFDERYYLHTNPDVMNAVLAGHLPSGGAHFMSHGQYEGRAPSALFDENFYRVMNPDVAGAVGAKALPSGFYHFINWGHKEGRRANAFFDERWYRALNPDVDPLLASGQFASAFEHYALAGESQGKRPSAFFSPAYYNAQNSDVVPGVAMQAFRSTFEHFLRWGVGEKRRALDLFDEGYYLAQYPDVAAAVAQGQFRSGYDHYVRSGQSEMRNPSATFSETSYLAKYADIASAVQQGFFRSGFEHYILYGKSEGRTG